MLWQNRIYTPRSEHAITQPISDRDKWLFNGFTFYINVALFNIRRLKTYWIWTVKWNMYNLTRSCTVRKPKYVKETHVVRFGQQEQNTHTRTPSVLWYVKVNWRVYCGLFVMWYVSPFSQQIWMVPSTALFTVLLILLNGIWVGTVNIKNSGLYTYKLSQQELSVLCVIGIRGLFPNKIVLWDVHLLRSFTHTALKYSIW